MNRDFCVSLTSNNLLHTIELYEGILGLEMRPLSHAIAMFKVGAVDIQVCQADQQQELLGLTLPTTGPANIMLTKFVESAEEVSEVQEKVREAGYIVVQHEHIQNGFSFQDLNGVTWLLEARPVTSG
jgi:predicted lactoylglutathione lyase